MTNKKDNRPAVGTVEETVIPNMSQPTIIDQNELINSINVLISAANAAQSKGAYNLEEAHDIWASVQAIHRILQPNQ